MKKLSTLLMAGLLIVAVSGPAPAWEFSMTGNFEWTYLMVAQGGQNGFFGPLNQVGPLDTLAIGPNAAVFNWAALNTWVGARLLSGTNFGLVSGKDASWQYMRIVMNPEIRVNPAIRLRAQYWIGSFNNWSFSSGAAGTVFDQAALMWNPSPGTNSDMGSGYYLNQQTASAGSRPIATGQWNLFWATIQLPWGTLVFGKRPGPFGMGLGNGEGERTFASESLALIAPYGPLRIGAYMYPWRQGTLLDCFRNINFGASSLSAPVAALGQFANATIGTRYQKLWDLSGIREQLPHSGMFVVYSNGPLEAGILAEYYQNHQGPEHVGTKTSTIASNTGAYDLMPTIDHSIYDGIMYVKYNNGRFFFNAEVDWDDFQTRFQPGRVLLTNGTGNSPVDFFGFGAGSVYQPVNTEVWQWASEFGFLCGPSKLSFLYAWMGGPDRRDGFWISKSNWNNVGFGIVSCNGPLMMEYSYLLSYTYAGGLNFRDGMGGGGMTDATVAATRLDYAMAANLNWYGTFFWAWRNSGGWPVGCLTINPGLTTVPNGAAVGTLSHGGANSVDLFGYSNTEGYPAAPAVGVPNIPDNNLGWEVTTGVDWKLLEGFVVNLRGAYWQPGEWFKFACVDRTKATAVTAQGRISPLGAVNPVMFSLNGTPLAVNPSKSIDPIWAFTGVLNVDF